MKNIFKQEWDIEGERKRVDKEKKRKKKRKRGEWRI